MLSKAERALVIEGLELLYDRTQFATKYDCFDSPHERALAAVKMVQTHILLQGLKDEEACE